MRRVESVFGDPHLVHGHLQDGVLVGLDELAHLVMRLKDADEPLEVRLGAGDLERHVITVADHLEAHSIAYRQQELQRVRQVHRVRLRRDDADELERAVGFLGCRPPGDRDGLAPAKQPLDRRGLDRRGQAQVVAVDLVQVDVRVLRVRRFERDEKRLRLEASRAAHEFRARLDLADVGDRADGAGAARDVLLDLGPLSFEDGRQSVHVRTRKSSRPPESCGIAATATRTDGIRGTSRADKRGRQPRRRRPCTLRTADTHAGAA